MINIKIKLDESVQIPVYHSELAAGCDLVANESSILKPGDIHIFETGVSLEIPMGYEGQVRSRSGLSSKFGIVVINGVGTIDADYRGQIKVPIINIGPKIYSVAKGDRIAQLVISPVVQANFIISDELSETKRGDGGLGSTGGLSNNSPSFTGTLRNNVEDITDIKMPERIAHMIVIMEVLNFQAGKPTDNNELLSWIENKYPHLKRKYSHNIVWPSDKI